MTDVYADTSYFIALLLENDKHHQSAVDWSSQSLRSIVITEYVLIELANFLARSARREALVGFFDGISESPRLTIVASNFVLFQRGVELFKERMDKHWSLTDCISFVVMQERGLTEALSFDRHFEQAGFTLLLK